MSVEVNGDGYARQTECPACSSIHLVFNEDWCRPSQCLGCGWQGDAAEIDCSPIKATVLFVAYE